MAKSAKKKYDIVPDNVSLNGIAIDPNNLTVDLAAVNILNSVSAYKQSEVYEVRHAKSGTDTMLVKGNLVIEDGTTEIDVGDFLKTIKERMLILQPNFEAMEQYPALKDAYDQYKMLEKLLVESNNAKKD